MMRAGLIVTVLACVASLALAQKEPWGELTRPLVIGHRGGACSQAPEHTIASNMAGFEQGVDVSECDVCWSRDLIPICRHEPYLSATTNALEVFPDRVRTKVMDGYTITDVWAEDLTLAELKTLRCNQKTSAPNTNRTHLYDGLFDILTVEEHIQLVLAQPRTIGIIPELKHSTYFNNLTIFRQANTTTMQLLLQLLTRYGYQGPINSPAWKRQPVWIQSFEQNDLVWLAENSCIPLVQLLDGIGSITVDRNRPFTDMISDASLDSIAQYATVFGPWKNSLAAPPANDTNAMPVDSGLIHRLHARGFIVAPYTFRPEANQMARAFAGVAYDEMDFFLRTLGIDGIWVDSTAAVIDYLGMEALVGKGWPLNLRPRLNQAPATCKRPSAAEKAAAKLQYPSLFP